MYSAESIFLVRHHSELSGLQALLLGRGVYDQYGAAWRARQGYKRGASHRMQFGFFFILSWTIVHLLIKDAERGADWMFVNMQPTCLC